MEREIKFRGKTKDGKWLHGSLVQFADKCSVVSKKVIGKTPLDFVGAAIIKGIVESETVGQWTGMNDVNLVDIYEGDIVRDTDGRLYLIEWNGGNAVFDMVSLPIVEGLYCGDPMINLDMCEIVGNRWDNPELLKTK